MEVAGKDWIGLGEFESGKKGVTGKGQTATVG